MGLPAGTYMDPGSLGCIGIGTPFGMHAERVEDALQLKAAIERAMANRPAFLDVLVTPEAVSSGAKSGLAWVPDLQAFAGWDEAERTWRGRMQGS